MKFEELHTMVQQDLKINMDNLVHDIGNIPFLSSKYAKLLLEEKIRLKGLNQEYQVMLKERYEFYIGRKGRKEDLKDEEFQPFKILRNEVDTYIDADKKLQELDFKIEGCKQKVDYLQNVLSMVNNRSYQISAIIKWKQFTNGVNN